eukprot:TRINITY_DN3760_c0_g2_i2.p1 TRINITY_DN3760_c0_g2~~TRINITY_DN3760_c0_g2_i2.p1  ORF type:complete len:122 (-),score=1.28 TRINITY_DN3760_c0_g2_i2:330-695(-)
MKWRKTEGSEKRCEMEIESKKKARWQLSWLEHRTVMVGNTDILGSPVRFRVNGDCWKFTQDRMVERSKTLEQGSNPKGRGFKSHSCHSPQLSRFVALLRQFIFQEVLLQFNQQVRVAFIPP